MALRTSRMFTVRLRPPCLPDLAGGTSGATCLHWASVRSLGYGFRFIPRLFPIPVGSHTASQRYHCPPLPAAQGGSGGHTRTSAVARKVWLRARLLRVILTPRSPPRGRRQS